jgi:hypothetical protein
MFRNPSRNHTENRPTSTLEKGFTLNALSEALHREGKQEICLSCIQLAQTILMDQSSPIPPEDKETHVNLQKKLIKLALLCHVELENFEEIHAHAKSLQGLVEIPIVQEESNLVQPSPPVIEVIQPREEIVQGTHSEELHSRNSRLDDVIIEPIYMPLRTRESHEWHQIKLINQKLNQKIPEIQHIVPDFKKMSEELVVVTPEDAEFGYALALSIQESNEYSQKTFCQEWMKMETEAKQKRDKLAQMIPWRDDLTSDNIDNYEIDNENAEDDEFTELHEETDDDVDVKLPGNKNK